MKCNTRLKEGENTRSKNNSEKSKEEKSFKRHQRQFLAHVLLSVFYPWTLWEEEWPRAARPLRLRIPEPRARRTPR